MLRADPASRVTTPNSRTVVGVFDTPGASDRALNGLKGFDFLPSQVWFVVTGPQTVASELIAALVALGIPEGDVPGYEASVRQGRILLVAVVHSDEQVRQAHNIFSRHGSDVRVYGVSAAGQATTGGAVDEIGIGKISNSQGIAIGHGASTDVTSEDASIGFNRPRRDVTTEGASIGFNRPPGQPDDVDPLGRPPKTGR